MDDTDTGRVVTALFVPGDRPDRFEKAVGSGADLVILDLEDAVAPAQRAKATRDVVAALGAGLRAAVRVVAATEPEFSAQLELLAGVAPIAVMLAKAESDVEVADAGRLLGGHIPLIPLIESAAGIVDAARIAAVPSVVRLAFGSFDFVLDVDGDAPELLSYASAALVIASRAAGIASPLAAPSAEIRDLDRVRAEALVARAFGFGGMLTIHPAQVSVVSAAFLPTREEIEQAEMVIAVSEGVAAVGGRMIDRPIIERARRTLARRGRSR
ncbi:HpcH/HpaI aldolase/citrate lyase family protein [Glaciibacter superstes]|uniref:HpcH/HpaI aldolase/citrate lyase family protein n=1 Tax=Glaciibacter superstes TaxID=501023 RepID=UPI000401FE49|nr:CoA ester lyase [Glaciibacter superstes]